jgi:hypothetical protein
MTAKMMRRAFITLLGGAVLRPFEQGAAVAVV